MARSAIHRVRALSAPSSSPSGLGPYAGHSCTSGIRRIGHEQHPMASPSEAPTGRVAGNRDGSADFDPCPPGHHLDVGAGAMTRQCVICGREFTVVRRIGRARVLCSAPCRKQRKLDIRLRWRRIFKPTQPWRVTSQDDCRGSMALVFAGIVPGCLLIGGATLDLGYRNVQVVKTRGCAEAAVLGLVQGGMTGASRMASANGCGLSGVSLTPGAVGPPFVPARGSLTAQIAYQPIFYVGGSVSTYVEAVGAVPATDSTPGSRAAVTTIK